MLMIRFQRIGRTNDPAFRIVLIEKERAAKAGGINEQLGTYNPKSKAFSINEARVKEVMATGAQPTDSIRNLLITKGILTGNKVNALPKKTPQKQEGAEVVAAAAPAPAAVLPAEAPAAAEVAPAPAEEAPALPTEAEVAAEAEPAPAEDVAAPAEAPAEAEAPAAA